MLQPSVPCKGKGSIDLSRSFPVQGSTYRTVTPSQPPFGRIPRVTPVFGDSKKRTWPTVTMFVAWLSTLLGGSYLVVDQHKTNQLLKEQQRFVTERQQQLEDHYQGLLEEFDKAKEGRGMYPAHGQPPEFSTYTPPTAGDVNAKNAGSALTTTETETLRTLLIKPAIIQQTFPSTVSLIAKNNKGEPLGGAAGVWVKDSKTGQIYILTNYHVVQYDSVYDTPHPWFTPPGTPKISISYYIQPYGTGEKDHLRATIVDRNEKLDLALLKVVKLPIGIKPITLRDIEKQPLAQGESVFAIGAPSGLNDTVTSGIISHTDRIPPEESDRHYVQTDAPINSGNSGGGLFDNQGRLIAINTIAIRQLPTVTDGIGLGIRSDILQKYLLAQKIVPPQE